MKTYVPGAACPIVAIAAVCFAATAARSETAFVRGDCNADGSFANSSCDIADPIFLLNHLFVGGPAPPCARACDSNGDGALDLSDAVHELSYCFLGGPEPPAPFPACGEDPGSPLLCPSFPPCDSGCEAQDARGVGDCEMVLGVFWDGFRCSYVSGCSCEGEDCDAAYSSPAECYLEHAACPSACSPMDVQGVGPCDAILGWYWDGAACQVLSGCSCEGEGCDRLHASPEECAAASASCPAACAPAEVEGVGPCAAILGWYWDGKGCSALSGCSCGGPDCGLLYGDPAECEAAHADCP